MTSLQTLSKCNIGQHLKHKCRTGQLKLMICTEKISGIPQWKFADGSPTLGEIFNPARDCPDIVDQLPEAKDGFYWIVLPNGTKHKVWCDVHTDGGGFTLVGKKDSPQTWTVPSSSTPVYPQGPPQWSSVLGDMKVLDFRVQFSTDKSFEGTKADWLYRLSAKRILGNLFSAHNNSCPYLQAGIGNISFVKDLMTQSVVTKNFTCSKFGPDTHQKLGWGRMNYCLQNDCKHGYAIFSDALGFRYDKFGSYSFSAISPYSGMNHDATAFIGCDQDKCCACFGPKGGLRNYCGPKCTAINGGKVIKNAFAWFWVRNRMPKRLWKRCMEFMMKNSAGKSEMYFIDSKTGTPHKGSCSEHLNAFLNEGTLTVSDKKSLEKTPNVPGLLSYRKDDKQIYVNQGSKWQALSKKKEVIQLNKALKFETRSLKKEINMLEKKIQKLKDKDQEILSRIDVLYLPTTCSGVKTRLPSSKSGKYFINPKNQGLSTKIQVHCDMTSKNGVGVTEIGHDSETSIKVDGYEVHGSYRRKIKYDIAMDQIAAIISRSTRCEQFVKYKCYNAGFWFSAPASWWVSRQGSQMKYWGGASPNSGKCACGMTNSCLDRSQGCNCDQNNNVWSEDSGYLTDKNTLPVTEVRFGDTGTYIGNPEYGYHTIGKLRCWK
ncbi:uncharacterized protein LOC114525736 [Dendronephthya gigantea]|uniref:uncharacterized protein LOC114525736 n=1 Tax=Dendronephthya gigantea TaxID=151771 RepID=UPI001068F5C6|nr:uncharacterized protein LOC114525736 [Dendronephthya gigantea]